MTRKKLCIGIGVLCIVDIIWVLSAELSDYIFHDAEFNKPFFTTYIKTSIFLIYLLGFSFMRRWRFELRHIRKDTSIYQNLLEKITAMLDGTKRATYGTTSSSEHEEITKKLDKWTFIGCFIYILLFFTIYWICNSPQI